MKNQMKFQKILTLVSLVIAALTFVFAITFLSGGLAAIQSYTNDSSYAGVDEYHNASQAFVSTLVIMSIIFILLAAFLYITSTNSRRKYYITNYIAIGAFAGFGLVLSIYIVANLFILLNLYGAIDWEAVMNYYDPYGIERGQADPSQDYTTFILGFILCVLVLVNVAAWVLNFIWKLKLMKGEKALIEQGLVKEVA